MSIKVLNHIAGLSKRLEVAEIDEKKQALEYFHPLFLS